MHQKQRVTATKLTGWSNSLLLLSANTKSAQWELNPHFRHGKAIGYRYIMGAKQVDFAGKLTRAPVEAAMKKADRKVTCIKRFFAFPNCQRSIELAFTVGLNKTKFLLFMALAKLSSRALGETRTRVAALRKRGLGR